MTRRNTSKCPEKKRSYAAYPGSLEKVGFKCCLIKQQLTQQPECGLSLNLFDILIFYKNYRLRGLLEQANMTNFSFFSKIFLKIRAFFSIFFVAHGSRSVGRWEGWIYPPHIPACSPSSFVGYHKSVYKPSIYFCLLLFLHIPFFQAVSQLSCCCCYFQPVTLCHVSILPL